ncbi:MAG TPA: TetR/AcrR family transcriptional regulator [Burkholderiaceae bacterium]|jgi:AcrR family transcriptional regulator
MDATKATTPAETAVRAPARERLLAAAGALFYEEGVNNVGIDKVIERAGVAKASLYSNFKSKDELVRAYLNERHAARQARVAQKMARHREPREKLLSIFDALGDVIHEPGYRGCAFMRASTELPAGSGARSVCEDARLWTRTLFADLAKQAGAAPPDHVARQMVMLYDGAAVAAHDGDTRAAALARSIAEQLLDAAGARARH